MEMEMKYGMNLCFGLRNHNDGMLPILEKLKSFGFDGVELPMFNLDLDYAAWGKKLDNLGLQRTAVNRSQPRRQSVLVPMRPSAPKAFELTKKTLDCCAAVGAQTLVGPYHSPSVTSPVLAQPRTSGAGVSIACAKLLNMPAKLE